jgi:hypothetical protein
MRRLYQHIYAALLLSLCVFAVLAGVLWRYVLDEIQTGNRVGIDTALAEVAMSAATATPSDLTATLVRLQQRLGLDARTRRRTRSGAPPSHRL